jgi:hypothetical protein
MRSVTLLNDSIVVFGRQLLAIRKDHIWILNLFGFMSQQLIPVAATQALQPF